MYPNSVPLGAFKENDWKKNYFPTDRPKYSEIPLEGNTTMFFFGLTNADFQPHLLRMSHILLNFYSKQNGDSKSQIRI